MSENNHAHGLHAIWVLFWEFFKIAALVVGGGFAILVVADDVFAKRLKWLEEGELSDMLAIIQTVPGLTAGNIAIYAGHRIAGYWGALAALVGVALPSFIVITIVAMFLAGSPVQHPIVLGAFRGVRTAMAGVTVIALIRVWKSSVADGMQLTLFALGIILTIVFKLNPGWLIFGSLGFGVIWCLFICRHMPKAATGLHGKEAEH